MKTLAEIDSMLFRREGVHFDVYNSWGKIKDIELEDLPPPILTHLIHADIELVTIVPAALRSLMKLDDFFRNRPAEDLLNAIAEIPQRFWYDHLEIRDLVDPVFFKFDDETSTEGRYLPSDRSLKRDLRGCLKSKKTV